VPSKLPVEYLLRLIDLCRVVGTRGTDPFQVDIEASLKILRRRLPDWRLLDELLLDSDAIHALSSIVRLQGEWLKHKASSLYIDPVLVELKIRLSPEEELARMLAESRHPLVTISQLFPQGLRMALDYWNGLLPFSEREIGLGSPEGSPLEGLSIKDLVNMRVLSEEEFERRLQELLRDAKSRAGDEGKLDYFDFIRASSFDETALRAYVTSFLVSEGRLALEVDPIEEMTWLTLREGSADPGASPPMSVATRLSYEDWKGRR
jgi:hypothetical protein